MSTRVIAPPFIGRRQFADMKLLYNLARKAMARNVKKS